MKVIGSLEESLAQVRDTFSQREAAIIRDRDEAAQRARCVCVCEAAMDSSLPTALPKGD